MLRRKNGGNGTQYGWGTLCIDNLQWLIQLERQARKQGLIRMYGFMMADEALFLVDGTMDRADGLWWMKVRLPQLRQVWAGPDISMEGEASGMSDYDEIRNLIASYSHYADDQDVDAYASNYTADGELIESGISITPRSRIRELARRARELTASLPEPKGGKHLQMNSKIDLHGDRASVVTDLLTIQVDSGKGWFIRGSGRYYDQMVKEDGHWRIKRREVRWHHGLSIDPLNPGYEESLVRMLKDVMKD